MGECVSIRTICSETLNSRLTNKNNVLYERFFKCNMPLIEK